MTSTWLWRNLKENCPKEKLENGSSSFLMNKINLWTTDVSSFMPHWASHTDGSYCPNLDLEAFFASVFQINLAILCRCWNFLCSKLEVASSNLKCHWHLLQPFVGMAQQVKSLPLESLFLQCSILLGIPLHWHPGCLVLKWIKQRIYILAFRRRTWVCVLLTSLQVCSNWLLRWGYILCPPVLWLAAHQPIRWCASGLSSVRTELDLDPTLGHTAVSTIFFPDD